MRPIHFRFSTQSTGPNDPGARRPANATAPKSAFPAITLLRQDPPMSDWDEVIMLLHTAAEVEHALLVQYLYAGYSVKNPQVDELGQALIQIALEEMAHLLNIQNILVLLGGPLNFERDDLPFNQFYPFPFTLEPFSVQTVARYVLAEMPDEHLIPEVALNQLKQDAGVSSPGKINRVGALYALLIKLVKKLPDDLFSPGTTGHQASAQEWSSSRFSFNLVPRTVTSRQEVISLLEEIGEQSVGYKIPPAGAKPSHFQRFSQLYSRCKALPPTSFPKHVPVNPSTTLEESDGYIAYPQSRLWGNLFNTRYRILLTQLNHYFHLDAATQWGKKRKIRLKNWCFEEMQTCLRRIASEMLFFPQHDPPLFSNNRLRVAAPPFELPYSLSLPTQEVERWKYHRRLTLHSNDLVKQLLPANPDQAVLLDILQYDQNRLEFIEEQISSGT